MSPERLNNASRSAANDIWSIAATFVQMISVQKWRLCSISHREQKVIFQILFIFKNCNEILILNRENKIKMKIINN